MCDTFYSDSINRAGTCLNPTWWAIIGEFYNGNMFLLLRPFGTILFVSAKSGRPCRAGLSTLRTPWPWTPPPPPWHDMMISWGMGITLSHDHMIRFWRVLGLYGLYADVAYLFEPHWPQRRAYVISPCPHGHCQGQQYPSWQVNLLFLQKYHHKPEI